MYVAIFSCVMYMGLLGTIAPIQIAVLALETHNRLEELEPICIRSYWSINIGIVNNVASVPHKNAYSYI